MNHSPESLADPVSLKAVLCTGELRSRPSRPPDHEQHNQALLDLAQHMADSPRNGFQKLTEVALDLCRAGSALVSLVSEETGDFYWPAIAGEWMPHVGGGTPRHFGPCGVVIEQAAAQLFCNPERCYPYLAAISPPIVEALLVPFYLGGKAVGTVWVVSHETGKRFDAEDQRLMESLCHFASNAFPVRAALQEQEGRAASLREINEALLLSSVRQHELMELATKAERALAESEERFRLFVNNVNDYGLFQVDPQGRISSWNTGAERIFGYGQADIVQHSIEQLSAPEDAGQARLEFAVALEAGRVEGERWLVRKDGTCFFARWVAQPVRDEAGKLRGFALVLKDETERREKELRALTAQLMTGQQEEQRRISRELHDNFAQKLALVEMDLHRLRENAQDKPTALTLGNLQKQVGELSKEVRDLSHRLHPSILEDLGLSAALRSLVSDLERTYGIVVQLQPDQFSVPAPLPVATALYRITQEAIRNVVKHGGEEAFVTISLCQEPGALRLSVQDNGQGFDPKLMRTTGGLGMLSMQERARQVGGSLEIKSVLGQGTIVTALVPV